MGISLTEIIVILAVVLLLFGAKRIPELARALGKASHEFKKAKAGLEQESRELMKDAEDAAAQSEKAEKKNDETSQGR